MLKNKRLERIEQLYNSHNKIYAVLGSEMPTGSIKDVTVYGMLKSYKEEGKLVSGGTVIEATSGNTGIALAYYQKEFDYHCVIVMPSSMSKQRREMIQKYGAELVLVDGGMDACTNKANELVKSLKNAFIFNQFVSDYNPKAHYELTGPFIYENMPEITYLFAGIGTGGTISGCSKYLKEKNKNIMSIGIEPAESPLISKGLAGPHLIQGIGANFVPDTYKKDYVDSIVTVRGEEAILTSRVIRSEEKLDIGISSGAALKGALDYLKENEIENQTVVVIFPDKGDRYSW